MPDPSSARKLEETVAIALLIAFAISTVIVHWGWWLVDFASYYVAADLFLRGQAHEAYNTTTQMIIDARLPEVWRARMDSYGVSDKLVFPFVYLPWFAVAFAPLVKLFDAQMAMNLAGVANTALLVVGMGLAWKAIRPDFMRWSQWVILFVVLAFTSLPITFAMALGQIQILVTVLCLLALERDRAGHPWMAGIALGLAACIKITPAAFALVFLLDRNWKALAGFAASVALCAVLSAALIDPALHVAFLERVRDIEAHVVLSTGGLSAESLLFQIADLLDGAFPHYDKPQAMHLKPAWIGIATKLMLLASVAAIVWRWLADRGGDDAKLRAWLALSIAVPLFGPLGWAHYFLLTTFLLPALPKLLGRRTGWRVIAAYTIVLFGAPYYVMVPDGWPVVPQALVGAPFLAVLLVVTLTARPERETPTTPTTQTA